MVMENALKVVHVSKKFPGLPPRTPRQGAALPDTPWLLWRLRRSHAARALRVLAPTARGASHRAR